MTQGTPLGYPLELMERKRGTLKSSYTGHCQCRLKCLFIGWHQYVRWSLERFISLPLIVIKMMLLGAMRKIESSSSVLNHNWQRVGKCLAQ